MYAYVKVNKKNDESVVPPKTWGGGVQPNPKVVPWVEKYRPKTVDDVVEQFEAISVLQKCIDGAHDLPNLLFYGPPGTGKTSTILAAARQLYGDFYRDRILELNASDERGINVIREKVKTFSQLTSSGTLPNGKSCPPFKIVILDEADSMTHEAQTALRRTMEKEVKSTRFCLICNYISRIIEPLTSRCTKFRFKPLKPDQILERLKYISNEEGIQCNEDALKTVVQTSNGDMRRAITCLQSCAKCKHKKDITTDDVLDITGVVHSKWVKSFFDACKTKNLNELANFVNTFIYEGYSSSKFLDQLNSEIIFSQNLSDKQIATISQTMAQANYYLEDGAPEYLQLLNVGSAVIETIS